MRLVPLSALLAVTAGCPYLGGEASSLERCETGGGGQYDPTQVSLRDPATGECQPMSGGVRESCDDGAGAPAPGALPDWGSCSSYCDALSETECLVADGCRAVYVASATDGPAGAVRSFAACWATAASGPLRGGVCEGLGAQECSRYDDCSAVHDGAGGVPGAFRSCVYETICDPAFVQPQPDLRNPETGACESGAGGGDTDPCTTTGGAPAPLADWGQCGSACEGYDEITCLAAAGCRAIHAERCPPWTDCTSVGFVACWPIAPSGPAAPGACAGLSAYECSLHNDCIAEHEQDFSACSSSDPSCTPVITWFLACRTESYP